VCYPVHAFHSRALLCISFVSNFNCTDQAWSVPVHLVKHLFCLEHSPVVDPLANGVGLSHRAVPSEDGNAHRSRGVCLVVGNRCRSASYHVGMGVTLGVGDRSMLVQLEVVIAQSGWQARHLPKSKHGRRASTDVTQSVPLVAGHAQSSAKGVGREDFLVDADLLSAHSMVALQHA
jgi:hypothetical protein